MPMRPQSETSSGTVRSLDRDRLQLGAMADERVANRVRLGSGERAHGVDEAAARIQGVGCGRGDADLELGEPRELGPLWPPEQLRAPAGRPDPRARGIHEYAIESVPERGRGGVLSEHQDPNPQSLRVPANEIYPLGVHVARDHATGLPDQAGGMAGLAAGSRTDIQYTVAGTRRERRHDERRRLILDGEQPFRETGQPSGISAVQQEAVGVYRSGSGVETGRYERLAQSRDRRSAGVRSETEPATLAESFCGELRVVPQQHAQLTHRPWRKPRSDRDLLLRLAQGWRRRVVGEPTKDRVHEAALSWARQLDRFPDRRVSRDPGEGELVGPEA